MLILDLTPVTDAGLEHLTGLVELDELSLQCTEVTDAGLSHLTGLRNSERCDFSTPTSRTMASRDSSRHCRIARLRANMADPTPKPRRFHPTPSWLVLGLLAVEGLLWLSQRFQWLTWSKGYAVLIAVASVGVAFLLMSLWLLVSLLFRWRFQFSIRSLLVLTVAVALPFSWLAVEMKAAREQHDAVAAIWGLRGSVVYDWQDPIWGTVGDGGQGFMLACTPLLDAHPPGPAWLRNLLGDDYFGQVEIVDLSETQVADDGLERIQRLSQTRILYLGGSKVTDAGLAHLAGLTQLEELYLGGTQVTDQGAMRLRQALPQCHFSR